LAGLFSLSLNGDNRSGIDVARGPISHALGGGARFHVHSGTRLTSRWGDGGALLIHSESMRTCVLNAVGFRLWSLVEGGSTVRHMICVLADEYEATASQIETGVHDFLLDLLSKGFILQAHAEAALRPPRRRLHG
jgi:hypothetical protein